MNAIKIVTCIDLGTMLFIKVVTFWGISDFWVLCFVCFDFLVMESVALGLIPTLFRLRHELSVLVVLIFL